MSQGKQTVVSFRVDQHLAEVLNKLPDKSRFIREAIMQRFYRTCPFCQGHGVAPHLIANWLEAHLPTYESVECSCCHFRYPREVVADLIGDGDGQTFVCPHCAEHDHAH